MKDFEIVIVTAIVSIVLTYLWCRSRKPKAIVQTFGKNPTYYDVVYRNPDHKRMCNEIQDNLNDIAKKRGINIRFNNPTRITPDETMGGHSNRVFNYLSGNGGIIVKASEFKKECTDSLCTKKRWNFTDTRTEVLPFDITWAVDNSEKFMDGLLRSGVID